MARGQIVGAGKGPNNDGTKPRSQSPLPVHTLVPQTPAQPEGRPAHPLYSGLICHGPRFSPTGTHPRVQAQQGLPPQAPNPVSPLGLRGRGLWRTIGSLGKAPSTVRTVRGDLNQTNLKRQGRGRYTCHRVTVIAEYGSVPGPQRPHGDDHL